MSAATGGPLGEGCPWKVEDCSPAYLCIGCCRDLLANAETEVNAVTELERISELADISLKALADEREGDFTRDVLELHTHAAALMHLVATW